MSTIMKIKRSTIKMDTSKRIDDRTSYRDNSWLKLFIIILIANLTLILIFSI